MEALIKAIKVRYDDVAVPASVALKAALTGGLHLGQTPMEDTSPYCVVLISEDPFYTFEEDFEHYNVTFSIFSGKIQGDEVVDIYSKLKPCFDEAPLAPTGYHLIRFFRVDSSPLEKVDDKWQITVEYECWLEEL